MRKINRLWLTAVVLITVLALSIASMASENVEYDVNDLSVEICVVNAGFGEADELIPNEQGSVDAILMVKNNNGGISEINYTLTGDGVSEEHHIEVAGMNEELLQQQEMADWSVIERAEDEISCLAGMVNISAQNDVSIYLSYSDLNGNSYSNEVSYSISETVYDNEKAESIDEIYDTFPDDSETPEDEGNIEFDALDDTDDLTAEELTESAISDSTVDMEMDSEIETEEENSAEDTEVETETGEIAADMNTESEIETEIAGNAVEVDMEPEVYETTVDTEMETEPDENTAEMEMEVEDAAGIVETEAETEEYSTEAVTEAEFAPESENVVEIEVETEAMGEIESVTEPYVETVPETYPAYSEPIYYPVYVPVSGGTTTSKPAKNYSTGKISQTESSGKTLEQQFDEKLEAERKDAGKKGTEKTEEKTEAESSEEVLNIEGSSYELEDVQYSSGVYLKSAGSLVIYENNADKLDEDSIVVTVVRNGETVELERDVDYTVVLVGNSANRKKYKYIISSHVFEGDGSYQLYIYSEDVKGNKNYSESKGLNVLFNVDNTEPLIINSQGENMQEDSLNREIIIRDNMQLSGVSIFLGDKKLDYEQEGETYRFTVPEEEQEAEVKIVAADIAGNEVERNIAPTVYAGSKGLRPQKSSMPLGALLMIVPAAILSGFIIRKRKGRKQKTVVLH